MAVGDAAAAAGMSLVPSTGAPGSAGKVRQGPQEINRTRDYIAQFFSSISLTWGAITGKPSTFPPSAHNHDSRYYTGEYVEARLNQKADDANTIHRTGNETISGGLTINGPLLLPSSSAATSGYTVAYINSDGRVSRGASSERFKKFISTVLPSSLGDLFAAPFRRFQMRADGQAPADPSWRYGYIAEELVGTAMEPFVVYEFDETGHATNVPISIDFIGLLLAQNAQLHERLAALEGRQ